MGLRADLGFLFNPSTVAVVGASDKPGKISGIIIESLKKSGYAGEIFPVNPAYSTVGGLRCYPSLEAVGKTIDLAVMALPAASAVGLLKGLSGRVRGIVIVSGGFKEAGSGGAELEKELRGIVKDEGIRVVGPNCMGLFDSGSGLDTFFIPDERIKRPGPGGLAILSQSGSFAVTAMDELSADGIGVSRVVSYGNKVDVDEADCLEFLSEDDSTTAVAVYIESISDGRRFVEAARRCSEKKPVFALKVGRYGAGASAARSHTGAIAGRYEVYRAAFRKAGLIELGGYEDFIVGCKAFGGAGIEAGGRRVMIITDGGGIGVELADACAAAGLEVPQMDDDVKSDIASHLPDYVAAGNPLDLTGSVTDEMYARALEKSLEGDAFDIAIVAALWGPPALTDSLAKMISLSSAVSGKPVLICSPGGEYSRGKAALFRAEGLPVFTTPESAVRAASLLAARSSVKKKERLGLPDG